MISNKKGQVALEFLVYAGVFLLIAVAAYALTYYTQRGEISIRESQMFREFGYKFQYAAIVAYRGGDGFTYDVYFQENMDGRPYLLTFMTAGDDSSVKTAWNGTSSEFTYLYTIPHAIYRQGAGDCVHGVSAARGGGVAVDPKKAGGHILLRNGGVEGGNVVITIDCGGEGA